MTNKLTYVFATAVLLLAAVATFKVDSHHEHPVVMSQNPLPVCPPFCDEPNGGGETAKRR